MNNVEKHVGLISAENIFYLVIGCVGAVILIIALLIFVYFRSIRKSAPSVQPRPSISQNSLGKIAKTALSSESYPLVLKNAEKAHINCFDASEASSSGNINPSLVPLVIHDQPQMLDLKIAFQELYADRSVFHILPIEELEGTFGEMKWAIWKKNLEGIEGNVHDEDSAYLEEQILVKTLKLTADQRHLKKFLHDALAFTNVKRHENLAQVIAIASYSLVDDPEELTDFPLVCYSHCGFGNLKKFLISCRNGLGNGQCKNSNVSVYQTLRTHELVSMALQILHAVIHLHNSRIIHKDIAARNCLVSEIRNHNRLLVQVCDSSLSKDFFPNDYHCLGHNENRPMKWMAYESLLHDTFSSSSDVWSFGVTLWELLSCGQQPYPDIDPEEIVKTLERGKRLTQPYNCPDDLYRMMYCCWQLDFRNRPNTEQLLSALKEFNVQLVQYI